MSDVGLIVIILVAFALAIGLVRVLGRLIDSDAPDWADESPDTNGAAGPPGTANGASASPAVIDPRRPR